MLRVGVPAIMFLLLCLAPTARAEPFRLLLDGAWAPHFAPIIIAVERGYFTDAGLEPTIELGRGTSMVAVMVGQRSFDFGHMTASAAASAIASGVRMRVVALYQPRTALALVGIKGRVRLEGLRSLEGLRVGATPGGIDGQAMTIFRRANSLGTSTMAVFSIEEAAKQAALVKGQVDVVLADGLSMRLALGSAGHEVEVLELADHGVKLQGFGFVASQAMLTASPDLARRALAAIRRGFVAAAADPAAACREMRQTVSIRESEGRCAEALKGFLAQTMPPDQPDWGRQSPAAWAQMIEAMRGANEIQGTRPASTYFTNDFLP